MKITTYVTVTDPIQMGFPVFEAVKSYLSFSDEVLLVVGRDTENFCKQISKISNKVVCLETNLWPKDWVYQDMTYHMNLGLQKADGDIVIKMDADGIFADQHGEEIRKKLIDVLSTNLFCHLDRLNYYHGYGYKRNSGATIYAINKKRMLEDNIGFEIKAPRGSNVIFINGKEAAPSPTTRISDVNLVPRNYDDTFCTEEQGVHKWFAWSRAFSSAFRKSRSLKVDVSTKEDYEKIKNEWLQYKKRKAMGCTTQIEHPNIILEKLSTISQTF